MGATVIAKRRICNIMLIVLCSMILVGAGLSVYFLCAPKNVIKMDVEPNETKSVRFKKVGLVPGGSCEYILLLSSEYDQEFDLTLAFQDDDPSLTLKEYAHVRIEKDDEVLCDLLLSELFEQKDVYTAVDFTDGEKNKICITYYMPDDVGNEAQDAEALFTLLVTATSE